LNNTAVAKRRTTS